MNIQNKLKKAFIAGITMCMLTAALTGCTHVGLDSLDMDAEPTPANYKKLASELATLYGQNPDDLAVTFAYAEKLTQLGDVQKAAEVLSPLLSTEKPNSRAILLSAKIAYLNGNYAQAETLYDRILTEFQTYRKEAEYGLQFVYYQTNQYQKAQKLSGKNDGSSGMTSIMRAYSGRRPYTVTWDGKKETTIPFVAREPLPVVEAELNGQKRHFIIDTGADDTYLNESAASELGLKIVAARTGSYAGGIEVTTNYGIVDSLRLGEVCLGAIPVNIAKMDHLANITRKEIIISGIIGTGIFKQFLVTMDYPSGVLTLKPRGEHLEAQPGAYKSSFIMAETHFTLLKALVNGKKINIWTDSGLADTEGNALLLTDGATEYLGIPIPEMKEGSGAEDIGGLGGADYSVGAFTAATFEIDHLPAAYDVKGLIGVIPGSGFEESEIFLDGIISHNFLKQYKWTIDYDAMTMIFESPAK